MTEKNPDFALFFYSTNEDNLKLRFVSGIFDEIWDASEQDFVNTINSVLKVMPKKIQNDFSTRLGLIKEDMH